MIKAIKFVCSILAQKYQFEQGKMNRNKILSFLGALELFSP